MKTVPVGAFEGSKLVSVYPSVKDAATSLDMTPVAMQHLLNSAEPHDDGRVYVRMKRPSDGDWIRDDASDPLLTLAAAGDALAAAVPARQLLVAAAQLMIFQGDLIRQRDQVIAHQAGVIAALLNA